ncbi:MAG: NAD(P)H-hydrate dehydratase [Lachnospiraceae bacterium]|nr:NAD(P)H-hydrate dehydratase [Lachnospiraceae bacterium]
MKYVVDAQEMKHYEETVMETLGMPSPVLMERAALAVAEEIREFAAARRLQPGDKRLLVVAGSGNNGADGLAVARILSQEGWKATVYQAGGAGHRTREWERQNKIMGFYPVRVVSNWPQEEYTVLVDALFGIGLSRQIQGEYGEIIREINCREGYKLSIDVPSGIHASTGRVMGEAVRADLTVTFGWAKKGLLFYPGAEYAGKLAVKEIGVNQACFEAAGDKPGMFYYEEPVSVLLPPRRSDGHKGSFGKVLLVAGFEQMPGAAVLAARAAYNAGAGMVKVVCPEENRCILQTAVPEALWAGPEDWRQGCEWADVVAIGPGLGRNAGRKEILAGLLAKSRLPLVLDADALNLIAGDMGLQILAAGQGETGRSMILTPHEGELSRLSGKTMEQVREDREHVSRALARDLHCILVCKGARTLVCREQGETCINLTGDNGMGTAGSGDVLTGVIAALLAQGAEAFQAASVGVYLHGLAGERAARRYGSYGLTAGRLAEAIGE